MTRKHSKHFALFLLAAALFYSCGSSNSTVVVVEDAPQTAETAPEDTVKGETFTELTIGLIDSVSNFDPLFSENLSTQRALSLIYEGLYTLDGDGNPVPLLVDSVQISADSLQYVFTLNSRKFFHNSPVFTAGVGRRITALDVKKAFERTAKSTVPEEAARLLMAISGFENYFLEQRSVYDTKKRVMDGVGGIQVLNPQTIAFVLKEKDPHFLEKLASPYLFVYPQESVSRNNQNLADHPVGTGPYYLNRVEQDGQIVLSLNEGRGSNPSQSAKINRINLRYFSDESRLYQEFVNGQVDWIPEIGPAISDQILDDSENLNDSYGDSFSLVKNNADRITALYLNQRTDVNHNWLINRLAYLTEEDIHTRGEVSLNVDDFEITENAEPQEQYYASFTDDSITRSLLTELHNIIFIPNSSLVLFDIRVPTKQTSIYSRTSNSLQQAWIPLNEDYWLRLDTQILGLYKNRVTGVEPTTVPWLLQINKIRVKNSE